MKLKIALLFLAVVAVALGVTLFVTRQRAETLHRQDVSTIEYTSNQWLSAQEKLEDEKKSSALLNQDLDKQKQAYAELTNSYTQTARRLVETESSLAATSASLKAAQETIAERQAKISELEAQNSALDQRASDLTSALTNLTTQIEDTRRKLAASEGDKAFLEKELKRLLAEKAERGVRVRVRKGEIK